MKRNWQYIYLSTALCMALAQAASARTAPDADSSSTASTFPVAYVYVSSTPKDSSNHEVEAYAAAASGKLTPVKGSPFQDDITSMAVNGKYLFGPNGHSTFIDAYEIESDGGLRYAASTDYAQSNAEDCGSAGSVFLDHTGGSLYLMEYDGNSCANNTYESFSVSRTSGKLHHLGSAGDSPWFYLPASFIGNNVYAYTATCLNDLYWEISGFKRSSSGMLSDANINAPTPRPKAGDFYCPAFAAADRANHVAITMQGVKQQDFSADGSTQLATYTAGSTGNLTTTSTEANMPTTEVGAVADINMAPSGKLLAVGGSAGLQVFHFNGANPITKYTPLLTKDPITQFFWDNDNHLYAISQSAGKLFVFTVTPTGYRQAPGSPYSVSSPGAVIVQPK